MNMKDYDLLLDELYELVIAEQERDLTRIENERYIEIVDILHDAGAEIPFGLEI